MSQYYIIYIKNNKMPTIDHRLRNENFVAL